MPIYLGTCREKSIQNLLFCSSTCVHTTHGQKDADVSPLKEEHAYSTDSEPGYGWEKLFTEELCRYDWKDHKFETLTVKFHSVYGPLGTYEGGKRKPRQPPAARSR